MFALWFSWNVRSAKLVNFANFELSVLAMVFWTVVQRKWLLVF